MVAAVELDPSPVVELRGVDRTFSGTPPVEALRGVDLVVSRGEYLSIVGPSGSGKSTLLNVLGCLDRPTAGTYHLTGIDVGALSDGARTGLRGQEIGFVFQAFHLLPYRTVTENVMTGLIYNRVPRRERKTRALEAIERVGLAHRATFLPTKISGGEQQRVAIARAIAGSPSLLLCDEPTGNLDTATTGSLLELFEDLVTDGLTLVVVTHDQQVSAHAERRVHMVDGRLSEGAV